MMEAALIGAGARGMHAYASYALEHPHELKFIAVAEPDPERRALFAKLHGIPRERQYASWEALLAEDKLCEALLICTQDQMHFEPTLQAIRRGYKILLEKPMSHDPLESLLIAEEAEKHDASVTVCHVMRYSPYYVELKRIVDEGHIGDIVSIQWTENVGFWHQAHSFVRGNWSNSKNSSPMILQKCCHDMDMLQWLVGSECTRVSSEGSLSYFREENAPPGSTERCTDGCAVLHECPYSALKWYYNTNDEWPQNVVTVKPDLEERLEALKTGPYGRCVYRCDNDVVDHQVATLRFANGVTVAFTMCGLTMENKRTFKIMGKKGEIRGDDGKNEIEINLFSGKKLVVQPETISGGHHGADTGIMRSFVRTDSKRDSVNRTSARVSANSHLIAFALEQSRLSGKSIELAQYAQSLQQKRDQVMQ